jgi:3-hydroxyacyl-[acyl-carrier-protein] dehydratase
MPDYLARLPHAPPMRLLERVVELVPGERCRAIRVARADDFYFQGHFPGNPIVPACILIELIAQAGGLAAGAGPEFDRDAPIQLRVAGIGPGKFPSAARSGAVLEVIARVVGRLGALFKVEGEVTADGVIVASGGVTLARTAE